MAVIKGERHVVVQGLEFWGFFASNQSLLDCLDAHKMSWNQQEDIPFHTKRAMVSHGYLDQMGYGTDKLKRALIRNYGKGIAKEWGG